MGAVSVPVTLKTRLGWDDDCLNAPLLARRAQDAGVAMVTIHGRTRCQCYKGRADWDAISAVVAALDVPVIANGDLVATATARAALNRSGARGVMVGRGAQGRPWRLSQIAAGLAGRPEPMAPRGAALADIVDAHYVSLLSFYGRDLGVRVSRKHLGWYMDYAGTDGTSRKRILTETNPDQVMHLLETLFHHSHKDVA